MNTVSLSISHAARPLAIPGVLLGLGSLAAWLLVSVVSGWVDAAAPMGEGPLLAPFRWTSRDGLA